MKNNLRELRERRGWSQKELGDRMGRSAGLVSQYESGKIDLNETSIKMFSDTLKVPVEEIQIFSQEELKEDAPAYRTGSIPLAALANEELEQIKKSLAARIAESYGRDLELIISALSEIGAEMAKRKRSAEGDAPGAPRSVASSGSLSEDEASAKFAGSHPDAGPPPGGDVLYGRKPATGGRAAHKIERHGSSGRQTKVLPPDPAKQD